MIVLLALGLMAMDDSTREVTFVDASLAVEELVPRIAIDVDDGEHVRAAAARIVVRNAPGPDLVHRGVPALKEHIPVRALCRNETFLSSREPSVDEVPVRVGHGLAIWDLRPLHFVDDLSGLRRHALQDKRVVVEGVGGVRVVDKTYLVTAVVVEIEGEYGNEPRPGNQAGAQLALPELPATK